MFLDKIGRKIKVVATDIDGTLTDNKYYLNIKAINAIRELEALGIKVVLVTGNSFPAASTLAHYIGTSGPVVAENGCVIGNKWEPILLADPPENRDEIIEEMLSLGFRIAPSTRFKYIDLGFKRTEKTKNLPVDYIKKHLKDKGYGDFYVTDSGFAVHIAPRAIDKAYGLKEALKLIKVKPDNVIYIGDGENDIPVMRLVGFSVAVGNAPNSVKKVANYVVKKPNGEGFSEFITLLLNKIRNNIWKLK